MRALDRKILRDLQHLRGQVLAIALVIASGVAVLIMSLSTLDALHRTTAAYYERYALADVFATAKRAPDQLARRIAAIPGVQTIQTRIVRFATLDIEDFDEPVIGQFVSVPNATQPALNRLVIRSGRWPETGARTEIIVNEPFADAHGIEPGDELIAVLNGKRRAAQFHQHRTVP